MSITFPIVLRMFYPLSGAEHTRTGGFFEGKKISVQMSTLSEMIFIHTTCLKMHISWPFMHRGHVKQIGNSGRVLSY